ncbi:MAG TPA: carboxypeptidase-like regulatory domain-containing protein [Polyangiaceae bacterium]
MFPFRFLPALSALLALALQSAPTSAAKVRVRGSTNIEARALVDGNGVIVRGRLLDDAGLAIAGNGAHARVRFRASRDGSFLSLPAPQGCDATSTDQVHWATGHATEPDEYRIDPQTTTGAFCVRVESVAQNGVVEIGFEGGTYYAGQTTIIDFDSTQRSLGLRFSPELNRIALDRVSHIVGIETELEPALSADEASGTVQLELVFSDDRGSRSLGTAAVRPGERAQFEVPSSQLGRPGPGRFTARYAGSKAIHGAERSAVVQKTLRVTLSVAGPVPSADPSDGLEIEIAVGSAQGAVDGGLVEARRGSDSVGTGSVNAGAARVLALFEAAHAGDVPIALHYVPAAPWWIPSEPLRISVPVKAPSPWRRLPWLLAALAIAAWLVRGWRRPGRSQRQPTEPGATLNGRAALSVIEHGPLHSGWRGRVLDAHDGVPIEGAKVAILTPAFGGDGVVRSAATDKDGRFSLDHLERIVEGARMHVSARWHAELVRPIPPTGEVLVSLVSRRRALLERLVEWADFRGKPWKQTGDSTPGHIARVARTRRAPEVARWAEAVEQAAFGPDALDEGAEHAVRAQEPEWGAGKPVMHRVPKVPS